MSEEKVNVWSYVNEINHGKHDIMTGTENDEVAEADYVPFLVNRALSYFPDSILYANQMNMAVHIDKKMQFHYLLGTVRIRKRFSKWAKRVNTADVKLISEIFQCNHQRAEEALRVLTPEQLTDIRERFEEKAK